MPPSPSILQRDFLPDRLAEILAEYRFDGSIAVQATTVREEVDWLLELSNQHEFIRGVVGWVDLTDANLSPRLDELQKHRKFRGVRHPVHDEEDPQWLLRNDVLRGLRELERRDLPFDLLLRPRHLPLVRELSDRFPNLRMVIDHIAKPPIAEGRLDGWAVDLELAAQNPRVFVKLSGMITEAGAAWTADRLRPFVEHVFSTFGPEHAMFGSDWPVCLLAGSWKQALAAFTQSLGPLPTETRSKLLGETAARFYGLDAV